MRRPSRSGRLSVCISDAASYLFFRQFAISHHSFFHARCIVAWWLARSKILCVVCATAIATVSYGQGEATSVRALFTAVRAGTRTMPADVHFTPGKESLYLDSVQQFLQDTMPRVRAKAYEIVGMLSANAQDNDTRTKGVDMLVPACADTAPGNAAFAIELLTHFRRSDFSAASLDHLRTCVRNGSAPVEGAVKIVGFLGLSDLVGDIRPYAQPGNAVPVRWAALLALARLGDVTAIDDITRRVKKFQLSDNLVYDIFPDLIYTRQRQLIDITVNVLQEDENSCMSANPEKEVPIPCGYRIMEMLAPVIDGYPVRLEESGDIRADDYPEALRQVRHFFSHSKNYKIRTDQY